MKSLLYIQDQLWNLIFDMKKVGSGKKEFAGTMTSNGVDASFRLRRKKKASRNPESNSSEPGFTTISSDQTDATRNTSIPATFQSVDSPAATDTDSSNGQTVTDSSLLHLPVNDHGEVVGEYSVEQIEDNRQLHLLILNGIPVGGDPGKYELINLSAKVSDIPGGASAVLRWKQQQSDGAANSNLRCAVDNRPSWFIKKSSCAVNESTRLLAKRLRPKNMQRDTKKPCDDYANLSYTSKQRRHETRTALYNSRRQHMLLHNNRVDSDDTVPDKQIQMQLNKLGENGASNRTAHLESYLSYLKAYYGPCSDGPESVCDVLWSFFSHKTYRVFNMMSKRRRVQSESDLVQRIRTLFGANRGGPGRQIVIYLGDWSNGNRTHLPGLASTPMKGFRKLLAKHFLLVTTNESYSTKTCCHCHERTIEACLWRRKAANPTSSCETDATACSFRDMNRCFDSTERREDVFDTGFKLDKRKPCDVSKASFGGKSKLSFCLPIAFGEGPETSFDNKGEMIRYWKSGKSEDEGKGNKWWKEWREVRGLRKCTNTVCVTGRTCQHPRLFSRDGGASINILDTGISSLRKITGTKKCETEDKHKERTQSSEEAYWNS